MKKQTGFTLIEIMIALALGLIVVAATIAIYVATVNSSSGIVKSARVNHDLEAVMTIMISDIRRAGYWGGARVQADSRNNPFTVNTPAGATTDIEIPSANCVLYSYDANVDGIVDANEFYGFRLNGGVLQMRTSGSTTDDAACADGTWSDFVYSNQITVGSLAFSFVPAGPVAAAAPLPAFPNLPATSSCLDISNNNNGAADTAAPTVVTCPAAVNVVAGDNIAQKRMVNIMLGGYLSSDTTVVKTLVGTVEVRNSRFCTAPC